MIKVSKDRILFNESYGEKGRSMKKGRLFVISGPSGTGKGSICKEIRNNTNINLSVSMTTREPRCDEIEGENYFFVEDKYFLEVLENEGFLEHAEVYGSLYGTPKEPVINALDRGEDVILEIDIQGALKVKKSFPDGVFIFILPPSLTVLKERLHNRGTETKESIELRMNETVEELSYIHKYDYYVVNEDLKEAAENVAAIMKSEHSRINSYTDILVKKIIDND